MAREECEVREHVPKGVSVIGGPGRTTAARVVSREVESEDTGGDIVGLNIVMNWFSATIRHGADSHLAGIGRGASWIAELVHRCDGAVSSISHHERSIAAHPATTRVNVSGEPEGLWQLLECAGDP